MNKTYRSIFVSDVHLGTKDSQAGKLNNFLKHNTCDTLYLVGDIIDAWRIQQNKSGKYVSPDDLTFAAAADGADWFSVPGMGLSIVDQKNPNAWPVSSASFIIMYKTPANKANSDEVLKFFDWAFKNGKKDAADLDYVALPDSLTKQIRERVWTQIK